MSGARHRRKGGRCERELVERHKASGSCSSRNGSMNTTRCFCAEIMPTRLCFCRGECGRGCSKGHVDDPEHLTPKGLAWNSTRFRGRGELEHAALLERTWKDPRARKTRR
jgi:hypothetical protein